MESMQRRKQNHAKDNEHVSGRVVELQQLRRYTDDDMASFLGVSTSHYSRKLKKGRASYTQDTLTALAMRGFDVNYILTGETVSELPMRGLGAAAMMMDGIRTSLEGLTEAERTVLLKELLRILLSMDD